MERSTGPGKPPTESAASRLILWLILIAFYLGNLRQRVTLPKETENWLLASLRQRPVNTGGRLAKHACYCWPLLEESHLTPHLFRKTMCWKEDLLLPAGKARQEGKTKSGRSMRVERVQP